MNAIPTIKIFEAASLSSSMGFAQWKDSVVGYSNHMDFDHQRLCVPGRTRHVPDQFATHLQVPAPAYTLPIIASVPKVDASLVLPACSKALNAKATPFVPSAQAQGPATSEEFVHESNKFNSSPRALTFMWGDELSHGDADEDTGSEAEDEGLATIEEESIVGSEDLILTPPTRTLPLVIPLPTSNIGVGNAHQHGIYKKAIAHSVLPDPAIPSGATVRHNSPSKLFALFSSVLHQDKGDTSVDPAIVARSSCPPAPSSYWNRRASRADRLQTLFGALGPPLAAPATSSSRLLPPPPVSGHSSPGQALPSVPSQNHIPGSEHWSAPSSPHWADWTDDD